MKFIQVNNDLVNLENVTNIQLNGMEITIFYTSGAGTRIIHDDVTKALIRFSQIKLELDGMACGSKDVGVSITKRKGKVNG